MLLRKTAKAGIIAGAVALASVLLPNTAAADGPTFSIESTTGAPGENVPVNVFLSEGPADTAAYNFTVVFSNSGQLASSNITGQMAPGLGTGFTYLDNSLTTSEGLEYRAVLYSSGPSVHFNSAGQVHIATINVPLSPDAQPGQVIGLEFRNEFDTDGRTGLVGVSNAAGSSIVPGGVAPADARPNAEGGTVTVEDSEIEYDFRPGPDLLDDWEFAQIIPNPVSGDLTEGLTGQQAAGTGFNITQDANNTFGFMQTRDEAASLVPSAGPGNIMYHTWVFASDAERPRDVPAIRLRNIKGDQPWAQTHEYQQPSSAIELVPTEAMGDVEMTAVSWVPPARTGGDPARDGFILAFDILSFGVTGVPDTVVTVKEVKVSYKSEDSLANEQLVYQHDYSTGDTDGFDPPNEAGIPGAILPVTAISDVGLGVISSGPPGALDTNTNQLEEFAFGWWERIVDEWIIEAGKIYRIDYSLGSTAPTINEHITARLRLTAGENDFIAVTVVDAGSEDISIPSEGSRQLRAYVNFPDVLAGEPVKISFDGLQTNPAASGGIYFEELTVRSFDRP